MQPIIFSLYLSTLLDSTLNNPTTTKKNMNRVLNFYKIQANAQPFTNKIFS